MSSLSPELTDNTCNGWLVCLDTPLSLAKALQRTMRHLKMEYFLLNKDLQLKLLLSRQSLNHFSNLIPYIF